MLTLDFWCCYCCFNEMNLKQIVQKIFWKYVKPDVTWMKDLTDF